MQKALTSTLALLVAFLGGMSQTLYWNSGSGEWNNPQNWSLEPGAEPASSIPDQNTHVIFPLEIPAHSVVSVDAASCASLLILNKTIQLSGNQISIVGDVNTPVEVDIDVQLIDYQFEAELPDYNLFGGGVTCGTGAGETPFTIEAIVFSDYNGEDVSCNGAEDGIASVNVAGGSGNFSFSWIGGVSPGSSQEYPDLAAGTYTILVTDIDQDITCVDNIQITEPPQIAIFSADTTLPSCDGVCDGGLDPLIGGGIPPYDILWSSGETDAEAIMLCEGENTLTVTDQNNCIVEFTITLNRDPVIFNLDVTDILCNGASTGAASVNPEGGGGPPYSVSWSTGDSGNSISGQPAGSYTVTVTDGLLCPSDTTFTIDELDEVTVITDNIVPESCPDADDGSIEITPSGGMPGYSFSWTGPDAYTSSDEDIFGLGQGTYNLTITDGNLCVFNFSFDVPGPPDFVIDSSLTPASCNGAFDGAIDITVNGGTPGYVFLWTGPNAFTSVDEDISGLEAGIYTVQITDLNSCITSVDIEVTEPDEIIASEVITPVSCTGGFDGAIDISPSGGSPGYTYSWTGPNAFASTDEDISGLEAGTYDLTITDLNLCTADFSFELIDPELIDASFDITPISCPGANDAFIDLTISGGQGPYITSWTGPNSFVSADEDIGPLEPGTYDLTITDDNLCSDIFTVIIDDQTPITFIEVITDVSCGGLSDGAIELSVLGGTPDYTFSWTGPNAYTSIDEDIADLVAGDYTVTVIDFAGCSAMATFTVNEEPILEATADITHIECNGDNNGAIDLNITGGVPGYIISWTGPNAFTSSDEDISGLEPGIYCFDITDSAGCTYSDCAEVMEAPPLDISISPVNPSCFGLNDGSIELIITGGEPPYTVTWDGGQTGEFIEDLFEGSYIPTIVDDFGCTLILDPIILDAPDEIVIEFDPTNVLCFGDFTGAIDATVSGGQGGFIYAWTGPNAFTSSDEDILGLEAGTYTLELTDIGGCTNTASIDITEESEILIDGITPVLNCANDLGSVDITVTGGVEPYSYSWTGPNAFTSIDEDLIDLEQGTYTVEVTDNNDCIQLASFTLIADDPMAITAVATDPACGINDGSIEINISGGDVPYIINWTGPNAFASSDEDIFMLEAGDYVLNLEDQNGCIIDSTFTLNQAPDITLTAEITSPLCATQNTGAIDITVMGGSPDFTYTWTGPDAFGSPAEDITNLNPGDYTLNIIDAGGCTLDTTFTLTETAGIIVDAVITDVFCGGNSEGAIQIEISGGTPDYIVEWDGPNGFMSSDLTIFSLAPGDYDLTVTDANNCVYQETYTISEPQPLELEFVITNPSCGLDNGEITVIVTGGQVQFDYLYFWYDVSEGNQVFLNSNPTITDLSAGLYQVEVFDDNGCAATDIVPLTDQPLISNILSADVLCNGDMNGAIDLTIVDGTEPFIIEWDGPNNFESTNEDLFDLEPGDYTLYVLDNNGCEINDVVTIDEPDEIIINPDATSASCNGDDSGQILVDIFGGTPDYSISWIGPNAYTSADEDIFDLEPGTYEITVSDLNGCQADTLAEITEPEAIEITLFFPPFLCFGQTQGYVDLTVNGGSVPYEFNWTGPDAFEASSEDLINLLPGTYTLNLIDGNDCVLDTSITIGEAAELEVQFDIIEPTCNESNGSISSNVTGGVIMTDYLYFWYDVTEGNDVFISSDPDISNLSAGIYFFEVFDDFGCSASELISLSDSDGIIEGEVTDVSCFGDFNGAIDITVSGGTEPYNFEWNGPNAFFAITEDISGLEAGTYTLILEDFTGCVFSEIFEVGSPDEIDLDVTATPIACNGDDNGQISVIVTGGTPGYDINWFAGGGFSANGDVISDLQPDCYDLVVQDSNFCQADTTICLIEPEVIVITADIEGSICGNSALGGIDLTISGGVLDYMFGWTGPDDFTADTEDISDLIGGDYEFTLTDANNCIVVENYFVDANPPLAVDPVLESPLCNGGTDGIISLNPSGGVGALSVDWIGPDDYTGNGATINNLDDGQYIYLLTDDLGCFLSDTLNLDDRDSIIVLFTSTNINCFGLNNGSIDLEISGGAPDYIVDWDGPNNYDSAQEDISNLEPGTYQYTVTDENDCVIVGQVDIFEPELLTLDLNNLVNPSCPESFDGLIDIEVNGGIPDYIFSWTGPDFTSDEEDIDGLGEGLYSVQVTDQNGCTEQIDNLELFELGAVEVSVSDDFTACESDAPFVLEGSNTGGITETWYDENGNEISEESTITIDPEPGDYFFVFEAVDGPCSDADTVFVTILPSPDVDAGEDIMIFPEEIVQIGGNPTSDPMNEFAWSPNQWLNDTTLSNPSTIGLLDSITYIVTVTDFNGCVGTDSVFVDLIPELVVPDGLTPNADGINDTWEILNTTLYPSVVIEVYNRWGDQLYRNQGYTEPWDGTYDGNPLPIGTYYYVIEINEPEFVDTITGPVTILR